MTALKPIENRRVVGVASERHPLNKTCSMPECGEPTADAHHCFPRSQIGNDSWFVALQPREGETVYEGKFQPIPHVTGLCREHHDAVEAHDAWIRLEEGAFVWYDRQFSDEQEQEDEGEWVKFGPLDPQPCSGEKRKKPAKRLKGEARRKRRTISIKVPNDTEDGGALWDEMLDNVKTRLVTEGLYDEGDHIPVYEALMAAANDWLSQVHFPFPGQAQSTGG